MSRSRKPAKRAYRNTRAFRKKLKRQELSNSPAKIHNPFAALHRYMTSIGGKW